MALAVVLLPATLWAMTVGASPVGMSDVADALFQFDGSRGHLVVWTVRLPRVLSALLVGSSLAVAGAIMQAVTNNPLASPGLLGVNAGAAFAVVLAIVLAGASSTDAFVWCAFGGAAVAAVAVYALGSMGFGGATPMKLAVAGAVLSIFLASLTTAILLFDQHTLDTVRLWTAGTLAGRQMSSVLSVMPYTAIGLAAGLLASGQIMTLSLGGEVASSLGQNQALWRALAAVLVVVLAGSAVALAGPIGFVGLVAPHIARLVIGVSYRWIIAFCALAGPLLVLLADTALRGIVPDRDIPVGVTMAVIGAPLFIYLARYRIRGGV